jgi:hypothetical protein
LPADMLTAKIEYGFDQLTARSGGVLDGPSHVAMGRRAAAAIGHVLGSPDEGRMIEAYLTIWREAHLPHLPAGSRGLSKEEFVRSNLALASDPVAREEILGGLASTFFELADNDADGRVDREEFWAFQHGHFPELTRADLGEAFDHLDTDRDGYLSREQFTSAIVEYWTSRDPEAPGNWWLGRPIYARLAFDAAPEPAALVPTAERATERVAEPAAETAAERAAEPSAAALPVPDPVSAAQPTADEPPVLPVTPASIRIPAADAAHRTSASPSSAESSLADPAHLTPHTV